MARGLRIAAWGVAALLVLVPFIAMQFTDEVDWGLGDFVFAAVLVLVTGGAFELAVRKSGNAAYLAGVGVALAAAFVLVWVNAAVGIIGSEDDGANLMYGGVLAVGIIGAAVARFRPRGMARAMLVTAIAQVLVAVIALATGQGAPGPILGLTAFFAASFVGSALLFRKAARGA